MSEKKIVLIDLLTGGHHPTYINEFVQVLNEDKVDFHVLYPNLEELSDSYSSYYSTFKPYLAKRLENSARFKTIALWLDISWNLYILKKKYKNQLVFISWMDTLRFQADHPLILKLYKLLVRLFGPSNWMGLYFHPTHLRMASRSEKTEFSIDSVFTLPTCKGIALLDEGVKTQLEYITKKPVIGFPDITNIVHDEKPGPAVAEVLKLAKGRRIVSLLGMQSKRKGVLSLIRIASECIKDDVFFLFGGPLDRATYSETELSLIDDFVERKPENCFFHFEHLQDGPEFNELVKLSSLIYAVYLNFPHSSNLLVKAAFFGKPVLVSNEYYMGELVDKYQLGDTVNPNNLLEIKEKIINYNYLCINDKLQRKFFKLNAKENLKETFQRILKIK